MREFGLVTADSHRIMFGALRLAKLDARDLFNERKCDVRQKTSIVSG